MSHNLRLPGFVIGFGTRRHFNTLDSNQITLAYITCDPEMGP